LLFDPLSTGMMRMAHRIERLSLMMNDFDHLRIWVFWHSLRHVTSGLATLSQPDELQPELRVADSRLSGTLNILIVLKEEFAERAALEVAEGNQCGTSSAAGAGPRTFHLEALNPVRMRIHAGRKDRKAIHSMTAMPVVRRNATTK
jgi:hypothetical protein